VEEQLMEEIVSYCGLICLGCPILWATKEKDLKLKEKMRVEIAKMSNSLYKTEFGSKDITDCDGCLNENGRLFAGCNQCQIRICARAKKIQNCTYCDEYICEKLEKFFVDNADAKIRLAFIRSLL
jgi:hypothetical protein